MRYSKLDLPDAVLIDVEPFSDQRGVFSRFFCSRELAPILKGRTIVNVNFSHTNRKGSIRGMHFQRAPHAEMKLVRCIKGTVYDVIMDIRESSPTYLKWHGEILSAENMKMLAIPEGFAHGFQSLEDDCQLLYLTTEFYHADAEGGIRYDDPAVSINWPIELSDISDKDASHPYLEVIK